MLFGTICSITKAAKSCSKCDYLSGLWGQIQRNKATTKMENKMLGSISVWRHILPSVSITICKHKHVLSDAYSAGHFGEIRLDRASIFEKLKPTAARLKWPPEEYSDRYRKENENFVVFFLKCVHWILINWQSFPDLFYDTTELSNMAHWLHSKPISEASQYDLLTNTEFRVVFPRWLSTGFKTGSSQTMSFAIESYFSDQWGGKILWEY